MTLTALGAIARLARRTARREWKRTLLIVLLVAVSVGAAVVAAGVTRAGEITEREWALDSIGGADLEVEVRGNDPAVLDWTLEQIHRGDPAATGETVRTYAGTVDDWEGELSDVDPTSPLTADKMALARGNAPERSGEVALSADVIRALGVGVGDTVSIRLLGGVAEQAVVTGVVQRPFWYRSRSIVVAPEELDHLLARGPENQFSTPTFPTTLLVATDAAERLEAELDDAWAEAGPAYGADDSWESPAVYAYTRASLLGGTPDAYFYVSRLSQPQYVGTFVAGLLLAEVALVAGAAYATGTRRRLRELGLLSANGATPRHLQAIVVSEGVIAGVVGAGLGIVLGVAAVVWGRPIMQPYVDKLITGIPLRPIDLLGPALVGVAATTVAAWWPARTASRVPARTALQGRMPLHGSNPRTAAVGTIVVVVGSLLFRVGRLRPAARYRIAGGLGVAMMIGGIALLSGPLVSWLGRHADRMGATPRLVLRDAARQRTRAATAISAVMVLLVGLVVIAISTGTTEARYAIQGLSDSANQGLTPREALYAGAAGILLVVLFVVALITALSATESDNDLRLMVAVGGAPRLRRKFLGLQTAFYVFVAGLLAIPLGRLIWTVAHSETHWVDTGPFGQITSDYVAFPWVISSLILVVMPVVVGTVTALVVRSAPTMPPRTVD